MDPSSAWDAPGTCATGRIVETCGPASSRWKHTNTARHATMAAMLRVAYADHPETRDLTPCSITWAGWSAFQDEQTERFFRARVPRQSPGSA